MGRMHEFPPKQPARTGKTDHHGVETSSDSGPARKLAGSTTNTRWEPKKTSKRRRNSPRKPGLVLECSESNYSTAVGDRINTGFLALISLAALAIAFSLY